MSRTNDADDPRVILDQDDDILKKYGFAIIGGIIVFVLAVVGVGYYAYQQHSRELEAGELLTAATQPVQWLEVVNKYPKTSAAGEALLMLAHGDTNSGKFSSAIAYYQQFLKDYPDHPAVPVVELAVAECLQASGKKSEARAAYEHILTVPQHQMATPAALDLAKMFIDDGNTSAARQLLTRITEHANNSQFSPEAKQLLIKLEMDEQGKAVPKS